MDNKTKGLLRAGLFGIGLSALAPNALSAETAAPATPAGWTEEMVVTGARTPREVSDLASSMSVIDESELIEQLGIDSNILSTLDVLVPGLTVSQGEFRSGCRSNIRGRPAQFLINGVPTNDNLRSSNCGGLFGLSPFAIERVELVRGSTALFGAGAPGGVINLITRRAPSAQLEVDAIAQWSINPHETNSSGEYNLYAGAGQELNVWDYYVGLSFQDYGVRSNPDGGTIPGDTFSNWSMHSSLGRDIGRGELRLTSVYFVQDPDDVYGTDFTAVSGQRFADRVLNVAPFNPFASDAETEQYIITLAYTHPEVLGHAVDVSFYMHDESLTQRTADFFAGQAFVLDTDQDNERIGVRSALTRSFALNAAQIDLTYGLDFLHQRYYRPIVDPARDEAVIGFIAPEVLLDQLAVFAQPQMRLDRWLFTGGVRHEWFYGEVGNDGFDPTLGNAAAPGDTPNFDLTLFNIGTVFDLTEAIQVHGGFSQGAEISEFGRAARGITDPGLINLDAATSDQYEIGVRGSAGPVDFSVAAFYSESDKGASLQFDPRCQGQPICPLIPLRREQEFYGAELTADWRVRPDVLLGTVVTYQQGEFKDPGVQAVPAGADVLSPPRATGFIEFEPLPAWRNRLQGTYFGSTDEYDAAEQLAGFMNTDAYGLVDFTSSYPIGPGHVTIGVANLLNEKYINVTNQASGDFFYYLSEGTRITLSYAIGF